MPIYEYQCENCGERSSALLARFDSADPACPACGEPRLRRLVSTFATHGSEGGDEDLGGGDSGLGDDYGHELGDGGGAGDLGDDDDW
jgi:putative FmdB family regulatory protein